MRRQGQRQWAVGVLEEDGVAAQGVDRRRLDAAVAVGRQVVGAQGVDRDQDDRRAWETTAPAIRRQPASGAAQRIGHDRPVAAARGGQENCQQDRRESASGSWLRAHRPRSRRSWASMPRARSTSGP